MHEKTDHPTQKPEELLRRIILASSNILRRQIGKKSIEDQTTDEK